MPKHVACVNGTDTVCCGSLQHVYQFCKTGIQFHKVFVPSGNSSSRQKKGGRTAWDGYYGRRRVGRQWGYATGPEVNMALHYLSCHCSNANKDLLHLSFSTIYVTWKVINSLMPSGYYMYRRVVTICTASLTFNNSTFCPHTVFMCFVWISEQTANFAVCNTKTSFFIA